MEDINEASTLHKIFSKESNTLGFLFFNLWSLFYFGYMRFFCKTAVVTYAQGQDRGQRGLYSQDLKNKPHYDRGLQTNQS